MDNSLFEVAPLAPGSDDAWETPTALFDALHAEFDFTVDAAATAENTKVPDFWADGLAADWTGQRVWCNPPFSDIEPWIAKASEAQALSVLLVPANRTDRPWWHRYVEPERRCGGRVTVRFLPGRVYFIRSGSGAATGSERPAFGCCLLIWNASYDGRET